MEPAKQIFLQYQAGGINHITALLKKEVETELQDFKTAQNVADRSTKQALSEALSGFANSGGGVIVWGVDCRKIADSADVVQGFKPISNLSQFISDLNNLSPHLVSPAVVGVSHFPIEETIGSNQGYAVTLVPKGEALPHMAVAQGLHRFMFRSGASFMPMPQWMVADRFGRRPQPNLELVAKFDPIRREAFLGIKNDGRAIATQVSVSITGWLGDRLSGRDLYHLQRANSFRAISRDARKSNHFTSDEPVPIPPGCIQEIGFVGLSNKHFELAQKYPDEIVENIQCSLSCDGFWGEWSLLIRASDLLTGKYFSPAINPEPDMQISDAAFELGKLPSNIGRQIILSGGPKGGTVLTWPHANDEIIEERYCYRLQMNADQADFTGQISD